MTKRLLDVTLLLTAAPLWLPVCATLALAVLVCDGRPVFFRQLRVGQAGRMFRIWKLRTMTMEPELAARRPTRLGGWLRVRGLDELPQLLNVLQGHMSLVGPRPLTPEDGARLAQQHPAFAARLHCRPGITGLSQVCGARGAALTSALDAHYARTTSVRLDLSLILRTAWINVVGKRRGQRPLPELSA